MKFSKYVIWGSCLAFTFLASLGQAVESFPKPKVDFSADSTLQAAQMSMEAKFFYSPGKERRETRMQGMTQVLIVRHDKNLVWMLMPDQKMYMEVDMKQAQQMAGGNLPDNAKIDRTKEGEEEINGIKTTRYRVTITQPDGSQLNGLMWLSKEDILMKIEATAKDKSGKNVEMKMELKNVKLGKQDTNLFELPAGYNKLPMNGFPGASGFDPQKMGKPQDVPLDDEE